MIQSLGIGNSGLAAAQRGIEVVSHNLANINTPGYSRQRVEQQSAFPTLGNRSLGPGAYGNGVTVTGVSQLRDALLDSGMRSALGDQGMSDEVNKAMTSIQHITGTLQDGLSTDLSKFWSAWTDVAASPTSVTARSAAIDAGSQLARSIRSASTSIEALVSDSGLRMVQYANQATSLAQQVASLNASILEVSNAGGAPNDFIDQRNVAVEQLSKLTGAQVRANGAMIDVTVGGSILVSGVSAEAVTVVGSPPEMKVNGGSVTPGGSIGGLQTLAGNGVDDVRQRLNLLANGLRNAMNTAHAAGTDLNGDAGIAFFTGSGAADFKVNDLLTPSMIAASAGGETGDANNALAIADLRYAKIVATPTTSASLTLTAGDAIADIVSQVGQKATSAQRSLDSSTALVTALTGQRSQASGVSMDEELSNLLQYQRAYQAAARVVTASDELLDTLINHVGLVGR